MRLLKSELRLNFKNRKSRSLNRAVSMDSDVTLAARTDPGITDSAISSPSTPNSSLSSQSNLISTPSPNSPCPSAAVTPGPGTPGAQQQLQLQQSAVTPTNQQSNNSNHNSSHNHSNGSGSGSTSGHKNSLKGTKLARRARSFKDDLFERIWQMRTPTNTLGRSHSPQSPRSKHANGGCGSGSKAPPTAEERAKSSRSLETHVKDISNALKHFRDVILKKKLEMLPGNGTVILETIASMFSVIQSQALNENNYTFMSAKQQVFQALGKLLKLCDDVMLTGGDGSDCAALSNENVKEVVDQLEDAVKSLVALAQQRLKERDETSFKYGPDGTEASSTITHNHLMRPPIEVAGQRTSLPDITLTPKSSNPPPLPPKRRTQLQLQNQLSNNNSLNSDLGFSSDLSLVNFVDFRLSVRSRSPDENSSQCSLDSALNHSREEEELKALGLEGRLEENLLEDDVDKMFAFKAQSSGGKDDVDFAKDNIVNKHIDGVGIGGVGCDGNGSVSKGGSVPSLAGAVSSSASIVAGMQKVAAATVLAASSNSGNNNNSNNTSNAVVSVGATGGSVEKPEMRKAANNNNNRHSNESGFVSMQSFRTSTQSVSKRSSDYSAQSSTKSSSNSEIASNENTSCEQLQQQQQQTQRQTIATGMITEEHYTSTKHFSSSQTTTTTSNNSTTTSSASSMMTTMTTTTTSNTSSASHVDDNHSPNTANSPEHFVERNIQSTTTLHKINSLETYGGSASTISGDSQAPPALPPKLLRSKERHFSSYEIDDAVDDGIHELPELRQHGHAYNQSSSSQQLAWQSKHQSLIESRHAGACIAGSLDGRLDEPPPLPVKKKYILAYMEVCSQSKHVSEQHRHTMHSYNMSRSNISHSQTMNIVPMTKELSWPEQDTPPALPPKNYKQRKANTATPPTIITTPPPSPKPSMYMDGESSGGGGGAGAVGRHERVLSSTHGNELMSTVCEEFGDLTEDEQLHLHHSHHLPNVDSDATKTKDISISPNATITRATTPKLHNSSPSKDTSGSPCYLVSDTTNEEDEGIEVYLENKKNCVTANSLAQLNLPNVLEEIDISPYIIFKKDTEDGPDVKGGYIDALIVQASTGKKGNAFSEAFITTFRTFIQPIDVIEKLAHRYTIFFCQMNEDQKQKAAKEAFSLLVRVVNGLTATDLTPQLFALLGEFIFQVVCEGQLYLAKLLRQQYMEKVLLYKNQGAPSFLPEQAVINTQSLSLLDLKSVEIAEQMTLLDAELFQKIEIPEVLLFAKEQCEEKSPNLNKFTEHFNKMSYWARSKILSLEDAKDREKHVIKFIKIMKHLRKMNNYNSYLALLSALDSAPIRRLEWHKTITESLKEYCTLIDSSSSFRVYRQALAETSPPCIPYIGLVLQDLTFVHVGNPDYLKDGVVNFSKRWQQHNIIVNMKRFKKCSYPFRRNQRIIQYFGNFEKFLSEEEMWQISEQLKPRGKRPIHNN